MDLAAAGLASELAPQLVKSLVDQLRKTLEPTQALSPDQEIKFLQLASDAVVAHVVNEQRYHRLRRNQLAPIHRLPTELISLIFEFAHPPPCVPMTPDVKRLIEVPMNVSGVSKRWRHVALTSPRIWTTLDAYNAGPFTSLCIERSKNASPRVRLGTTPERMALLVPLIPRCQVLDAVAILPLNTCQWLSSSTPFLECLAIQYYASDLLGEDNVLYQFVNNAPRLRQLHLEPRFFLPATHPAFPKLAKLSIDFTPSRDDGSFRRLIEALQTSQLLEELSLDGLCSPSTWEEPQLRLLSGIALPDLKIMTIKSTECHAITFLLERLILPTSLHLSIKMRFNTSALAAILPSSLDNIPSVRDTRHLRVLASKDKDGCTLLGRTNAKTESPAGSFSISMEESYIHKAVRAQEAFHDVPNTLPGPLISLTIDSYANQKWSAAKFARGIVAYTTIEELAFIGCHPKFIQTLALTPTKPPCPALQKLTITNCDGISPADLLALVQARTNTKGSCSASKIPLQRLEITDCPGLAIDPETLARLKKCVDIYWDGENLDDAEVGAATDSGAGEAS